MYWLYCNLPVLSIIMIYQDKIKVNNNQGVKILSNARAREGVVSAFTFYKIIGSPAKRAWRAGKKERVLGEGIFCPPGVFGWWVCVAEGDAQVRSQRPDFAQNRFGFCPKGTANLQFWRFGKLLPRPRFARARQKQ